MKVTNRLKNQHLLWRAAFGSMAEMSESLDKLPQKKLWNMLLEGSKEKPQKIGASDGVVDAYAGVMDSKLSAEEKAQRGVALRKQSRDDLKQMNIDWLNLMVNSPAQLREKMSLFWHGHFATRQPNSFFQQGILHIIRTNALGNFGTLLREVSKSPAMLQFLNNQQNRKQHPNENFAREVMELFTLGRGNYTENDIKEAARAFTGWGFNAQVEFVFRKQVHDADSKTIFGNTGNYDGDGVIDLILRQPQTAVFITTKIYRYFVNEEVEDTKIKWLADRFRKNNYELLLLLEDIYTSDWFYSEKNIGAKIKSPVELIAGIRRMTPVALARPDGQLVLQQLLGQVLFFPPNVAGWPGGRNWIDSSTLMLRLQIPQMLYSKEAIALRPKQDDDVNMGMMSSDTEIHKRKKLRAPTTAIGNDAEIDWPSVIAIFANTKREELGQKIADSLLQTGSSFAQLIPKSYVSEESREAYIKTAIINIMATPEFQMC